LLVTLFLFTTAWAFDEPWFLQPVSSARKLNGDELLRIGEIHDVQNHFPEALTYYEQALEFFRANKQRRGEATTLTKIGSIFERQGRREAASARLRDALSLFSKFPDHPAHADALFTLGRVSAWLGSRAEAGRLFERAMDHYGRSRNVQGLGLVRIQLGLMRISDGLSEEGFRFLQQALEDAQNHHESGQTLAALLALGDANWIMDEPEAAKTYYEQSLVLIEERPQASIEAGLRYRFAAICGVTGQQEKGIGSAKRAVTLYQSLRDPSGEAASWSLLASLYQAIGQNQQAEEAAQRALSMYRQRQLMVHAVS
jgi:tetratricopeptide (TPR) repeat protein